MKLDKVNISKDIHDTFVYILIDKLHNFIEKDMNKDYKLLMMNNGGDVLEDEIGINDSLFLDELSFVFYETILKQYKLFPDDNDVILCHFYFHNIYESGEYNLTDKKYSLLKIISEEKNHIFRYNKKESIGNSSYENDYMVVGSDEPINDVLCLYDKPNIFVCIEVKRMHDD